MKIHLAWIRVAATAAIMASGIHAHQAAAQYAPYRPVPQGPYGYPTAQQPYAPQQQQQQPAYQPYRPQPQQQQPAAPYAGAPQYPQSAARYSNPPQYRPYPNYAVAQQPTPAGEESLPVPAGATTTAPPNSYPSGPVNGYGNGHSNGHVNDHGNGHVNGHAGYPADAYPPNGHQGYADGCASGYPATSGYGTYGQGPDYGVSQYFDTPCSDTQWFGGVYLLYMERDNPSPAKLTFEVDHPNVVHPYYPPADTTIMSTHDTDFRFRPGVEIRFGSTFTIGSACDYGCQPGCGPACPPDMYAWEFAWWGLQDDEQRVTVIDTMPGNTVRMYGMKNFVGLEYDRDAGATWDYRPVNDYYGYGYPKDAPLDGDGDIQVLAQRVRTNFSAQNLELNMMRFPLMGCSAPCGGGYDACGYGASGGYGAACAPVCAPSPFSMYGLCGVRYFRMDDEFRYATEFGEYDAGGDLDYPMYDGFGYVENNELFYDVEVDNHLTGVQLGWNMNYCVACKWNFFCNSTFGVFNNHINHYQRMYSGGDGTVRFVNDGRTFSVRSEKNDIAFLGELRVGGSYDLSCHWRAVLAYRAVGISGVATSTDQIPDDFTNADYVGIIDSDSSIIVHGIQTGVECRY